MSSNSAAILDEAPRQTPIVDNPDVLVVGGGSAGLSAAVAAARCGADTLLLERYGYLGGLATGGMVILLLTLDDGRGVQVIAGLCQELVDRLVRRKAAVLPDRDQWGSDDPALIEHYRKWGLIWGGAPDRVRYSVAYEPAAFKFVADQMITEAKARLRLHSWATDLVLDGDRISHVICQSKSGRQAIRPKVVIDATGDGDLLAWAGLPFEAAKVHVFRWYRMANVTAPEAAMRASEGKFFPTLGGRFFHTPGEHRTLMPWGMADHVDRRIDPTSVEDLTYAEVESRRLMMEQIECLQAEVPGFAQAYLADAADQLGITETRRLVGDYVLRSDDDQRKFDDAVAVTGHWTRYGARYEIPYRALRHGAVRNILVSGRCISVDRRVHNATKEIPACMATGQAAGTAAALAAAGDGDVGAVEIETLRGALVQAGVILTPGA